MSRKYRVPKNDLVGGWTNPLEKYAHRNGFIFPKVRGENGKYLSCHHLVMVSISLTRKHTDRFSKAPGKNDNFVRNISKMLTANGSFCGKLTRWITKTLDNCSFSPPKLTPPVAMPRASLGPRNERPPNKNKTRQKVSLCGFFIQGDMFFSQKRMLWRSNPRELL